ANPPARRRRERAAASAGERVQATQALAPGGRLGSSWTSRAAARDRKGSVGRLRTVDGEVVVRGIGFHVQDSSAVVIALLPPQHVRGVRRVALQLKYEIELSRTIHVEIGHVRGGSLNSIGGSDPVRSRTDEHGR